MSRRMELYRKVGGVDVSGASAVVVVQVRDGAQRGGECWEFWLVWVVSWWAEGVDEDVWHGGWVALWCAVGEGVWQPTRMAPAVVLMTELNL